MKVNMTLPTMITWAGRRRRWLRLGAGGVGWSEVAMTLVATFGRPRRRALRQCKRRGGPFNSVTARCRDRPPRLADGLGLGSTPVPGPGPTPRSRTWPARWFPRSRALQSGTWLHERTSYVSPQAWQEAHDFPPACGLAEHS